MKQIAIIEQSALISEKGLRLYAREAMELLSNSFEVIISDSEHDNFIGYSCSNKSAENLAAEYTGENVIVFTDGVKLGIPASKAFFMTDLPRVKGNTSWGDVVHAMRTKPSKKEVQVA